MGTLHEDVCTFMRFRWILLRMINVSDKICRENQNTHFVVNNPPPRESYRLWGNVERYGRAWQATDDDIIQRMRFAFWIIKATDSDLECVILRFHGSSGYVNAPRCYVRTYIFCLVYVAPLWYTGCPRRNVPDFGRVFLMLKYTDITQTTYVQSWTVTEIMAREVWNFDSCYTLIDYQIHIKTDRNMWFL